MTTATARSTACAVAVHLSAHRASGATVHRWCETHPGPLAGAGVAVRTSDAALREAVPGLEWRSDRGRRRLHAHLTPGSATLVSTAAVLGPAYRHTGGHLHPDARAGVAALAAALHDVPWRVHLTVGDHASTVVQAWVDAVRAGHRVPFDDFAATLDEPSWVPLVHRLVRTVGADRVVVHDATRARPDDQAAVAAVARDVLGALLGALDATAPVHDLEVPPDPARWSARQVDVALAMLPHLRSWEDRGAMRRFVDDEVDVGGGPAWPVPPALADRLAACDAADLTRLTELVEVR
ncbi:hypothetical protein ATJ88_2788 [Isoptericola jiangsuensis]|uniref:Uncharacterized protein n=1 Tax=Isoptericola jiangsuensis TaxID=548579 RepID=A0A2A9F0N9_9MICO|nr:hypothetical protein [Isoptericola jiangsuensis]PFG44070.1 hypothetical protein ATJ88_2788 [Isoptericola jiangsuensis]